MDKGLVRSTQKKTLFIDHDCRTSNACRATSAIECVSFITRNIIQSPIISDLKPGLLGKMLLTFIFTFYSQTSKEQYIIQIV